MAFRYKDEWKLYQKEQKLDDQYYTKQQTQLNQWNTESAQKQMDFQKMMSDTSHQREVQDLIKAGLNPVLSANNGASTPSGAYANVDSSPLTAASQSRIANRQMRQNMIQNRMQLANAMAIAKYQAQMQFAAQKYATDMSYQLGMSGLANQLEIAELPYQDGNVNQTEKYKTDSNPWAYLTNMLTSIVHQGAGVSSSQGLGRYLAKLFIGDKKAGNRYGYGTSQMQKQNAQALADEFIASMITNKNYNISKRDWLKSYHEFANKNWNYDSEDWKRKMGYYFGDKDYK